MGNVIKTALVIGAIIATGGAALGGLGLTGGIGAISAFGLSGWSAIGAMALVGSAGSFLLSKLGPKPKAHGGTDLGRDYRQVVRQAVVPARWIYGRARVGGVLVYLNEFTASEGGDTDSKDVAYTANGKNIQYREGAERTVSRGKGVSAPTARECYEYRDVTNPKTGTVHRSLAWGPCGGGGTSGQQSTYTPDRSNQAQLKGSEGLFYVLVLSEGAIDGIEKIWVDGEEMPFSESAGVINPTSDETNGVKFKHEGKTAIRMYLHRGGASGSALLTRWGRSGALRGYSAIGVELAQYDNKPWSSVPSLEFAVKGVRMTWPGQTTAVWSENAAAIRWHYLTVAKEVPESYIDETRFRSAYSRCAAAGYTINGVVSDDEDYDQVIKQFDFAWAGTAPEIDGNIVFTPGAPGSIKRALTQDDLVSGEDPAWQIETPIYAQAEAVDAVIDADVDSDFLPYSMPRHGETGLTAKVQDLGVLKFVGRKGTAQNLMDWNLKHIQQQRRARIHVVPGDGLRNWNITATDRVTMHIPEEGLTRQRFYVEMIAYNQDGTLNLDIVEEPANLYSPNVEALPSYIEDKVFLSQIKEPTGLDATPTENPDGKTWDLAVTCNESPDGSDLHIRYRYADTEEWVLGGTGAELKGARAGTIQISARIVSRDLATDWTGDTRVLRVQLANRADPAGGPRLSYSGETRVEVDAAVNIVVSVTLEDNDETFVDPPTLTQKPSWLSVTSAQSAADSRVGTITLTGTMATGTDIDMVLTVTDGSGRSASITIPLESTVAALRISGVGDKRIYQGVATSIGIATTNSSGTVTWSIAPAVSGVAITSGGRVTATLSTLGDQDVTIKAVEAAGQRRTATLTITLTVATAARFGVDEENPTLLFLDSNRLYVGGVDTNRIYRLSTSYLADQSGATGMPNDWERAGSDGTRRVVYTPSGLRQITRFTTGQAITHRAISVASGDSAGNYRYLAVAGGKLYGVAVSTQTTYRTENYQGNCRDEVYYETVCSRRAQTRVTTETNPFSGLIRRFTEYRQRRDVGFGTALAWGGDLYNGCEDAPTRVRRTRRVCDTLTRRVPTTTKRLRLRVAELLEEQTNVFAAQTPTVVTLEQTTGSRSYTIHGVAVSGTNVYIYMTRDGTKGIWRCTTAGASLTKRVDRSDSNPVDMAADSTYLYVLDRGADRVNRLALP